MLLGSDEKALVKIITGGDELSLEEKINQYLDENPGQVLGNLSVQQTEYHSRLGSTEFGLMAVLTMRVKK
jgi:hypothetical protein